MQERATHANTDDIRANMRAYRTLAGNRSSGTIYLRRHETLGRERLCGQQLEEQRGPAAECREKT